MNDDVAQRTPQETLEAIREERAARRKGRLKVYFGMAAGVGKTYSMLADAQEARRRGIDVVVGYLEPHGRAETEAMAAGLEQLPNRIVERGPAKLREFDLDGAISRRPGLILVDELAHTNAPGSRHTKRWQDVLELVDAGIDVATTVNVQHVESLNDVVAQITGVVVRERVPDSVIEAADEIELVDLTPEELELRLRGGKVYVQEKVEQALSGFFRRKNLVALREIAMRHAADRIDADVRREREASRALEAWHAKERFMVCVAPNRFAPRVVRAARRMAGSLHAELIAASVESARQIQSGSEGRRFVSDALNLAERLGAETVNLSGEDIVGEILAYARSRNVTTLVVGKPVRPRWRELLFGSVVDDLIRRSGDIDVYVITGEEGLGSALPRPVRLEEWKRNGPAATLAVIAVCTLIGFALYGRIDLTNIIMVYLLGVTIVAVRYGRRETLLAAVLGVLAFDICFVPPRWQLAVSDVQYLLTFAVMLVISLMIGTLTLRLKEQRAASTERERAVASLFEVTKRLAASRKREEMARAAAEKVSEVTSSPVCVALWNPVDESMTDVVESPSHFERAAREESVMRWVAEHGQPAGRFTDTLPGSTGTYWPLLTEHGCRGVLGIESTDEGPLAPQVRALIESIAGQLAGAIERTRLAGEAHRSALQIEAERMRGDLLSSVSHDLRTPLAAISGAAEALVSRQDLDERSRDLAENIQEEAERMTRLVRNLLDMTRVEGGHVELSRDWHSLSEIVEAAVSRTETLLRLPVRLDLPADMPLLWLDGVLVEQLFVNLLENAARHAGSEVEVRVSAAVSQGEVRVAVCDNGPGIPLGDEEAVFQKFVRHGTGGFGLGLAICRAIAQAHGGWIRAENKKDGGVCFHLSLPLVPMPDVPHG